jgi:hypothetical protein
MSRVNIVLFSLALIHRIAPTRGRCPHSVLPLERAEREQRLFVIYRDDAVRIRSSRIVRADRELR